MALVPLVSMAKPKPAVSVWQKLMIYELCVGARLLINKTPANGPRCTYPNDFVSTRTENQNITVKCLTGFSGMAIYPAPANLSVQFISHNPLALSRQTGRPLFTAHGSSSASPSPRRSVCGRRRAGLSVAVVRVSCRIPWSRWVTYELCGAAVLVEY